MKVRLPVHKEFFKIIRRRCTVYRVPGATQFHLHFNKKEKGKLGTGTPLCTFYSLLVDMGGFFCSSPGAGASCCSCFLIHNFRRKASLPFK